MFAQKRKWCHWPACLGVGIVLSFLPVRGDATNHCKVDPETRTKLCAPQGGSIIYDPYRKRVVCGKGECVLEKETESVRCARRSGFTISNDPDRGITCETSRGRRDNCVDGSPEYCDKD